MADGDVLTIVAGHQAFVAGALLFDPGDVWEAETAVADGHLILDGNGVIQQAVGNFTTAAMQPEFLLYGTTPDALGEWLAIGYLGEVAYTTIDDAVAALIANPVRYMDFHDDPVVSNPDNDVTRLIINNGEVFIRDDGGTDVTVGPLAPSPTVADETTFGITPDAGIAGVYSCGDHTHGTPDPAAFVANGSTVDQLRDSLIAAGLMAPS